METRQKKSRTDPGREIALWLCMGTPDAGCVPAGEFLNPSRCLPLAQMSLGQVDMAGLQKMGTRSYKAAQGVNASLRGFSFTERYLNPPLGHSSIRGNMIASSLPPTQRFSTVLIAHVNSFPKPIHISSNCPTIGSSWLGDSDSPLFLGWRPILLNFQRLTNLCHRT